MIKPLFILQKKYIYFFEIMKAFCSTYDYTDEAILKNWC
ncbi:Uncharacterised protein [Clostridium baratii]|nr:Uncharacterised protein [Clostridium baratii]